MTDFMLDAADRYFDQIEQDEIARGIGALREDIFRLAPVFGGGKLPPEQVIDLSLVAALHLRARLADIDNYLSTIRGDQKADQDFLDLISGYEDFLP